LNVEEKELVYDMNERLSLLETEASNRRVTIMSNANLDELTKHGIYYVSSIVGGKPSSNFNAAYIQVFKSVASFYFQVCYCDNGSIFSRVFAGGVYSEWKTLV